MSYELNKKIRKIEPYEPAKERVYRVRLDVNESPFDVSKEMEEEIVAAIKSVAFNRYPDMLAEETARQFANYYGIRQEYVTVGNGSDELISILLSAFLEKNDNIVTLSPDFSMYAFYGYLYENKVTPLQKDINLMVNIGKVIDYCNTHDVKALIFSNPCNPTSLGIKREDIVRLVKNVFCLVVIDEAYMDFWDESVMDIVDEYDNLVVLKTVSKAMGMAGLRLGFAIAGENISRALRTVKSPYNVNSLTQAVCTTVLKNKTLLKEHTEEIIANRRILQEKLHDMSRRYTALEKVYDSVANFVLVKTPVASEICEALADRGVAIRAIGNCFRVTVGTKEENEIFLSELEEVVKQIKIIE